MAPNFSISKPRTNFSLENCILQRWKLAFFCALRTLFLPSIRFLDAVPSPLSVKSQVTSYNVDALPLLPYVLLPPPSSYFLYPGSPFPPSSHHLFMQSVPAGKSSICHRQCKGLKTRYIYCRGVYIQGGRGSGENED